MNAVPSARRWRWCALMLAAGCGAAPGGSAGAWSTPTAAAGGDAFAACRARADGAAPALRACADRELARIAATLPARGQAAPAHDAALRALGDDALARGVFGGGEAAAVAVAEAAVATSRARAMWLTGGAAPAGRADPRMLGAEARAAWGRSRAATCAAFVPAACAARYDALLAPYFPRP